MVPINNFGNAQSPSGPKWAKLYDGKIRGPEPRIKDGETKSDYSGLYSVVIEGKIVKNIPIMASSYSSYSNTGLLRLFDAGESVLIGETNSGQQYILGNSLLPKQNNQVPLPALGGFNRKLEPGEVLIGGPHSKVPERVSYIVLDGAGNIEVKAGYPTIKVNGDVGNVEIKAFRFGVFTESGSETWGAHPLIGNSTPVGFPRPGQYRRLVRCEDSNNWGPFVYTEQGNLGLTPLEIQSNPFVPIHVQNYNNSAAVLVNKSGGYTIMAGLPYPGMANARTPAPSVTGSKAIAPLSLDLDPIIGMSVLKAPINEIRGGMTGLDGSVMIRGNTIGATAVSVLNLTSTGTVAITSPDVTISAASIKMMGNVTIIGALQVSGGITTPVVISNASIAPFMSLDKIGLLPPGYPGT